MFAPPSAIKRDGEGAGAEERNPAESWSEPEPLIGGTVDLGALATEFLILGLDPYPAQARGGLPTSGDGISDEGPFAALAELKRGRHGH